MTTPRTVRVSVPEKVHRKLPRHVLQKLRFWVRAVEVIGLHEVRRQPGYHDEPLKGLRAGQRSIRLSVAYRAVYVVRGDVVRFIGGESWLRTLRHCWNSSRGR